MQVELKVFGLWSQLSSSCLCYWVNRFLEAVSSALCFILSFFLALLVLSLQKKDLAPSPGSLPLLLKAQMGE